MSIYSHTFSGNVAGHSIHKSILFWSVKIQKEVSVNLINQFRWDLLCSFSSLGLRRWTWFSLPPSSLEQEHKQLMAFTPGHLDLLSD